jgi:hypothetical protein
MHRLLCHRGPEPTPHGVASRHPRVPSLLEALEPRLLLDSSAGQPPSDLLGAGQPLAVENQVPWTEAHWTGAADNHWENAANWSTGVVPDATVVAVLDGPLSSFQPKLYGNAVACGLDIRTAGWTVNLNGHTMTVGPGGLAIPGASAPTSTIDLGEGALILDYAGPGDDPLTAVNAWVRAGAGSRDAGGILQYDGFGGITSSIAQANHLLAAVDVRDTAFTDHYGSQPDLTSVNGVPVDSTTVVVRFAWNGDCNLDGRVDVNDYVAWCYFFLNTPDADHVTWFTGDFNYDGKIDVNDYSLWTYGILNQGNPLMRLLEDPTCSRASTAVADDRDLSLVDVAANQPRTCQIPIVENPGAPEVYLNQPSFHFDVDANYFYWYTREVLKKRDVAGVDTNIVDITAAAPMKAWYDSEAAAGRSVGILGITVMDDGSLLVALKSNLAQYDGVHFFQRLYRSADGGATWMLVNSNLYGFSALPLTKSGTRVAYCDYSDKDTPGVGSNTGYGAWLSCDSGATWTQVFCRSQIDANLSDPMRHGHELQFGWQDNTTLYLCYGDAGPLLKLTEPGDWNGSDPWTVTTMPVPSAGMANEGDGVTSSGAVYNGYQNLIFPTDTTSRALFRIPGSYQAGANFQNAYGAGGGTVRDCGEVNGLLFFGAYRYSIPDVFGTQGLYASADGGRSFVALTRTAQDATVPYVRWGDYLYYPDTNGSRILRIKFPAVRMVDAVQVEPAVTNQIADARNSSFETGNDWHDWYNRSTAAVVDGGLYGAQCLQITPDADPNHHTVYMCLNANKLLRQPAAGEKITFSFYIKAGPGWTGNWKVSPCLENSGITMGSCTVQAPGTDGWTRVLVEGRAGASPHIDALEIRLDIDTKGSPPDQGALRVDGVMLTYDADGWREDSFQPAGTPRANEYVEYAIDGAPAAWRASWHWQPDWSAGAAGADVAIGHVRAADGSYVEVTYDVSEGRFVLSDGTHTAVSAPVAWRHWDDLRFDLSCDGAGTVLTIFEPVGGTQVVTGAGVHCGPPTALRLGVNHAGDLFGCGRFALPMATETTSGHEALHAAIGPALGGLAALGDAAAPPAETIVPPSEPASPDAAPATGPETLLDQLRNSGTQQALAAESPSPPPSSAADPATDLAVWSAPNDTDAASLPILAITATSEPPAVLKV